MAKNKAQQEQILLKNSNINIFLPENIKTGSNILIFGNTCNFFGVTNNIIFNNDNELDRLGRLIDVINNKCNFYIICSNKETYEYYRHLFNEVIYHNFGIKAQVKLEPLYYNHNYDKNNYIKNIEKYIKDLEMKFDICFMNPPYGQTLHYEFTEMTLKYAKNVISIMPNSIIKRDSIKFKKYKESYNNRLYAVEEVSSLVFDSTDMQNVAIYSFNEHTDNINITYIDNKKENINGGILNKDFLGFTDYENEFIKYLYNATPCIVDGNHTGEKSNNRKDVPNYIKHIFKKLPDNKVYLVVNAVDGSNKGGWTHKYFSSKVGQICNGKDVLEKLLYERGGKIAHYMWFDSISAAENAKAAMLRPLLRFSLTHTQTNQNMSPSKTYIYIPDIDWTDSRVTTDEGLLEVCGCPKDKAKEYAEYCRKYMEDINNK